MGGKKKDLIIITRGFPFGRGEAFLENEIEVLSKKFNSIFIFSQMTFFYNEYFDIIESRKLPKNVFVHKVDKFTRPPFFQIITKLITSKIIYKELISLIIKNKYSLINFKTALHYYFLGFFTYNSIIKTFNLNNSNKLYFYSYWFYHEPLACLMLSKVLPGKCFSRAHGGDLYENLHVNGYLPFRKLYLNSLDGIFCVSNKGKRYLEKHYDETKKIRVSKLGTLKNKFVHARKSNKLFLLSISAIYDVKRINLIIDALSLSKIEIEWHHFGDGPDQNKIYKLAKSKLTKPNVEFNFHGFMKNKDVITYLKNNYFDLIINTSSSEGIPVSIMEAISFGIPVVATNVGGTCEIVNYKNGYLLERNPSPNSIINIIEKYYYLNENNKEQKRIAAYNLWKDKYCGLKNYSRFAEDIFSL